MATGNDTYTHWRDSARIPVLFVVDARGSVAVILVFFHPSYWTISIAVVFLGFLSFLYYLKIPVTVALRIAKGWLMGKKKARILKR